MTFMTRKQYGEMKGWSRQYVGKLIQAGRLVLNESGLVDVGASEKLLSMTSDPSKAGVVARHKRERSPKDAPTGSTAVVTLPNLDGSAMPQVGDEPDFQKSRAMREHYLALQEQANFHQQQGSLVLRKAVEDGAYGAGRLVRDQLLGIVAQLAPELAVMTDPWKIERHLTAAIRRSLEDAERISSADREHALTPS